MKLTILHEPGFGNLFDVYEDSIRIVGFNTEVEARTYCENRQKARVIAEYDLSPTAAKPENPMTDSG